MPKNHQKKVLAMKVEKMVLSGEDITEIMGTPLSHFNMDAIVKELESDGHDMEPYKAKK
nr:MAG: hypothetical protein [Microvirus sp.]